MATPSNGDVLRYRVDQQEERIGKLSASDLSLADRMARMETRLDDVVGWLKVEATIAGGVLVTVVGAALTYLLTRGH